MPELRRFLALPDECRGCTLARVCGGGCKARRQTLLGDTRGRDLFCTHGPFRRPIPVDQYDSYLPLLPDDVSGDLYWQRDFWRLPVETLEDRAGDCEDASLLLASMLANYNGGRLKVWIIGVQNENRRHIAVAYPVEGGLMTILDPAGNYYTWHYSWSELRAYDVATVIRYWLRDWAEVMPDAEVYSLSSDKFYMPFAGTEEFVDWFHSEYGGLSPIMVDELNS